MSATLQPTQIASRRASLLEQEPNLRARDLAARLGVSEAELVAAGNEVVPLRPEFAAIIGAIPALGEVMALTRNESAVHEKTGTYGTLEGGAHTGLILGEQIDLRIFFTRWRHGFAVTERGARGVRHSLQFFDARGVAVHKIYRLDASDQAAYQALVDRFRTTPAALDIQPAPPVEAARPDSEVDTDAFRADWDALQDTHDFFPMLRRHKLQRLQALRLGGPARARRVQTAALRDTLGQAAAQGTPIMVFVGNPGMIQIHTGPVYQLKATGPWFNVLDPGFNLHLREDRITQAYVVAKPTADGQVTSLELFDAAGEQIATLFGKRKPGEAEDPAWRALVDAAADAQAGAAAA